MDANGVAGIAGSRTERMIGEDGLQCSNCFGHVHASMPCCGFEFSKKHLGSPGFAGRQIKVRRAAVYMQARVEFFTEDLIIVIVSDIGADGIGKEQGERIVLVWLSFDEIVGLICGALVEQVHTQYSAGARSWPESCAVQMAV